MSSRNAARTEGAAAEDGRRRLRYRISRQVEVELIFENSSSTTAATATTSSSNNSDVRKNVVGSGSVSPILDSSNGLLDMISLTSFTGRLVIHRLLPPSVSEATLSSVATLTTTNNEEEEEDVSENTNTTEKPSTDVVKQQQTEEARVEIDEGDEKAKVVSANDAATAKNDNDNAAAQQRALAAWQGYHHPGGRSSLLVRGRSSHRNIPRHIQEQRAWQRRNAHGTMGGMVNRQAGVAGLTFAESSSSSSLPLHILCAKPMVSLEELHNCLHAQHQQHQQQPHNASSSSSLAMIQQADALGRFPLHILADNEALLESPKGRQTATAFACHLIAEFPQACTTPDASGRLPFFAILADWVTHVNQQQQQQRNNGRNTSAAASRHLQDHHPNDSATADFVDEEDEEEEDTFERRHAAAEYSESIHSGLYNNQGSNICYPGNYNNPKTGRHRRISSYWQSIVNATASRSRSINASSSFDMQDHDDDDDDFHDQFNNKDPARYFPRAQLWDEALWCMEMLSTCLDVLGREFSMPSNNNNNSGNTGTPPSMAEARQEEEDQPKDEPQEQQEQQQRHTTPPRRVVDQRIVLVEQLVTRLPLLVRTILLVDNDELDSRQKVLRTAMFRRLLLCPQVLRTTSSSSSSSSHKPDGGITPTTTANGGTTPSSHQEHDDNHHQPHHHQHHGGSITKPPKQYWLVPMLKHGGVPARRAVDFLDLVSGTTIEDSMGGKSAGVPLPRDWARYRASRRAVFGSIERQQGMVASLVTMETKEIERAASTAVVWHTLSSRLTRPFVLGMVLIDLVLHLTLMIAFRNEANMVPRIPTPEDGLVPEYVIYAISSHYLVRKQCELWALLTVSRSTFWSYLLNLWTLFDLFANILALFTTIANHVSPDGVFYNGLNALVVGLLWIKVLAFLKVVNKEMATFVLSMTQILKDIRFFMLVLVVCTMMFGDMWHVTFAGKSSGAYCEAEASEGGTVEDFCSSSWESYLRTYSILLGDFDLDEITATNGSAILFVIFTVFGIIILLNVLIAVLSDSYEKATMKSHVLFGRARVMFVAQNNALEAFLKPPEGLLGRGQRNSTGEMVGFSWFFCIAQTVRWIILFIFAGSTVYTQIFLFETCISLSDSGNEDIAIFLLSLLLGILLSAGLWVVLSSVFLEEALRGRLPPNLERLYRFLEWFNRAIVKFVARYLFGLEQDNTVEDVKSHHSDDSSDDDEWIGRVNHMEKALERVVAEAKRELKAEMQDMKMDVQNQIAHMST